uniref:Uncharacterized protein n=1 Tax=Rousettus aegyptiacus TaxID=9407 RepID=A0A7J8CIL9_ROUAE|nr:hypothetical protein HJG63_009159 [Rousettus aegyptiacus]
MVVVFLVKKGGLVDRCIGKCCWPTGSSCRPRDTPRNNVTVPVRYCGSLTLQVATDPRSQPHHLAVSFGCVWLLSDRDFRVLPEVAPWAGSGRRTEVCLASAVGSLGGGFVVSSQPLRLISPLKRAHLGRRKL